MEIKVLGSDCPSCKLLYENVLKATQKHKDIKVEYITDITTLIEKAVLAMPVLMIDGKIISSGETLSPEEIETYINGKDMGCKCGDKCSCGDNCDCNDKDCCGDDCHCSGECNCGCC